MEAKQFFTTEDGKIISSLYFYNVKLPSRHLGVIEEVFTDTAHRKKGHATKLILEAIEYAKTIGCDCVELTVRQDRPEIQTFYKSLGFTDRLNLAYRKLL